MQSFIGQWIDLASATDLLVRLYDPRFELHDKQIPDAGRHAFKDNASTKSDHQY
jgi:hypothetical protein